MVLDPLSLGDPELSEMKKVEGRLDGFKLLLKLAKGEKDVSEKAEIAGKKVKSEFPSPVRIITGKKEEQNREQFSEEMKKFKSFNEKFK